MSNVREGMMACYERLELVDLDGRIWVRTVISLGVLFLILRYDH